MAGVELDPIFADALKSMIVVPEDKPLEAAVPQGPFEALCKEFAQLAKSDKQSPLALLVISLQLAEKGMKHLAHQCRIMVKAALDATAFEHMLGQAFEIHQQEVAATKQAAIDKPKATLGFSMRTQGQKRSKP